MKAKKEKKKRGVSRQLTSKPQLRMYGTKLKLSGLDKPIPAFMRKAKAKVASEHLLTVSSRFKNP
jgi:hypothetical protein